MTLLEAIEESDCAVTSLKEQPEDFKHSTSANQKGQNEHPSFGNWELDWFSLGSGLALFFRVQLCKFGVSSSLLWSLDGLVC